MGGFRLLVELHLEGSAPAGSVNYINRATHIVQFITRLHVVLLSRVWPNPIGGNWHFEQTAPNRIIRQAAEDRQSIPSHGREKIFCNLQIS